MIALNYESAWSSGPVSIHPPRPRMRSVMVPMLVANVGVLAIAVVYYAWRDGYFMKRQAEARRILRDRVAYMLWISANRT